MIVAALDDALGNGRDGVRFHPGVEYRHLVRGADRLRRRRVRPAARPHRPADRAADRSRGGQAHRADGRVEAGRRAAPRPRSTRSRPRSGCGARARVRSCPTSPSGTASPAGCRRRSTSCAASECSRASRCSTSRARPRASTTTTSRSATPRIASLADRDFFLLHVEATDEAGHQGAIDEKVTSLERWDAEIIGPLLDALGDEPFRLLLLPDHATPCASRTHTSEPVPYLLYGTDLAGDGRRVHRARRRRTGGGARARPHGALSLA